MLTRLAAAIVIVALVVVAAGGIALYGGWIGGPTPTPTQTPTHAAVATQTLRPTLPNGSQRPTPHSSPDRTATAPPPATPVAEPTPFDTNVHATGVVVPQRSAELAMSVGGLVSAIYVHVNEQVGVGQLLLKLNQSTYLAALDVAEAAVTRADAAVERATLAVEQLPPDATLGQIESAQAELQLAEADRALARSELSQAQADLRQTELRAPIAGTIAKISVSPGEQTDAGETIATIGDMSAWLIQTTDVSELEVVRIAVGDRATLTFAALPGQTVSGHVDSVELRGTSEEGGIPLFAVTIRPDVTLPQLRWNMSANVSIEPSG